MSSGFYEGKETIEHMVERGVITDPENLAPAVRFLLDKYSDEYEIVSIACGWDWRFDKDKKMPREKLIRKILSGYTRSFGESPGSFFLVELYEGELEALKNIKDADAQKIALFMLVYEKWVLHPSGWVRYEPIRKKAFEYWGMKIKPSNINQKLKKTGASLRVIGSANPVVCYHMSFLEECGIPVYNFEDAQDIAKCYKDLLEGGH